MTFGVHSTLVTVYVFALFTRIKMLACKPAHAQWIFIVRVKCAGVANGIETVEGDIVYLCFVNYSEGVWF